MSADSAIPVGEIIDHTNRTVVAARHPWPEGCFLQGGTDGVVFRAGGAYRTAFVEASPRTHATFLRGEGATLAEAEDACWAQYQRILGCARHEFDRAGYTNGAGLCTTCGMFTPHAFEPLPPVPNTGPAWLERTLTSNDTGELLDLIALVARAGELPADPRGGETP